MVGDAEDKARYARYYNLIERSATLAERAITAPTEEERRKAAEAAQVLQRQAFHLMV